MNRLRESFAYIYAELGRTLLIWAALAFAIAVGGGVVLAVDRVTAEPAFEPLYGSGYSKNQIPVPPVLSAGESFSTTAEKCSRERVTVTGIITLRRIKPSFIYIVIGSGSAVREPGCQKLTFVNALPDDLQPGIWELVGIETAYARGNEQVIGWHTTGFEVR